MKNICISIALFMAPIPVIAEVCNLEHINSTSPSEQFLDNRDGTITDIKTGFMWMKCTYGQEYSNGTCYGQPIDIASWSEALHIIDSQPIYGYTDFRLPNIKELGTIVERQCVRPSINQEVFPHTPSASYYSSTPYEDGNDNYRGINFQTGEDFSPEIATFRYVRLMRNARND